MLSNKFSLSKLLYGRTPCLGKIIPSQAVSSRIEKTKGPIVDSGSTECRQYCSFVFLFSLLFFFDFNWHSIPVISVARTVSGIFAMTQASKQMCSARPYLNKTTISWAAKTVEIFVPLASEA